MFSGELAGVLSDKEDFDAAYICPHLDSCGQLLSIHSPRRVLASAEYASPFDEVAQQLPEYDEYDQFDRKHNGMLIGYDHELCGSNRTADE